MVGSPTSSLISRVGRGVVVTMTRGFLPRRSPNISMSQASGYRQAATSSHHAHRAADRAGARARRRCRLWQWPHCATLRAVSRARRSAVFLGRDAQDAALPFDHDIARIGRGRRTSAMRSPRSNVRFCKVRQRSCEDESLTRLLGRRIPLRFKDRSAALSGCRARSWPRRGKNL